MDINILQITWDVSPQIFSNGIEVRWYGLMFALSFLIGYYFMQKVFTREKVPEMHLDQLALYLIIGAIVGARLGHCLFYQPEFYLSNPIEILKIWRGGLASHGGAMGIIISLYLFIRKNPQFSLLWILDRVAVPTALGGAFIRIGNFFNSEILGAPANVPWAVIFARVDDIPRHPAQIYEALCYLAFFFILWAVYNKTGKDTPKGLLIGWFFILVFSARFILEFFKELQAGFEESLFLNMGQLLSIPFVIAGIVLVLWSRKKK